MFLDGRITIFKLYKTIKEILKFTPREKEVILLFVKGLSYKLIADALKMSWLPQGLMDETFVPN